MKMECDWFEIVSRPFVKKIIEVCLSEEEITLEKLTSILVQDASSDDVPSTLLDIGVSSLQLFIQCNWTGPVVHVPDVLSDQSFFLSQLKVDGEDVYKKVVSPWLLVLARTVLLPLESPLWIMRTLFIHQQLLSESSSSLHSAIMSAMEKALKLDCIEESKRVQLSIECSFIHLYYQEWRKAKQQLEVAQKFLGVTLNLIGAMGKRTKYQEKALPQLALTMEKKRNQSHNAEVPEDLPKNLMLNDEVRLERIEFENENEVSAPKLNPLEQAVVLATFIQHERLGPQDELRDSELKVYLDCLLSQPQDWCIQASTLVSRCKLEAKHKRTVERAMMQTQELIDSCTKEHPPPQVRQNLFFCSKFPPRWELQRQYGELLFSLGVTKEALEVFTRLEMWESVINCYFRLEMKHKAETIARDLVAQNKTPNNLCILGDTTDEPSWYEEAWELSNQRCARAQRALGNLHFSKQRYAQSIPHYEKSVQVNGTQLGVWFRLAFAAMESSEWETAAKAYRRCVNLDPDSFEAWNNLSKCYIKLGQKARAWKTLQEALKCNYEEWKIWDNYLLVSVDCGAFDEVIVAYNRLLDLKDKHVDTDVLKVISSAIRQNKLDCEGKPVTRLNDRVLTLLGRLTAKVPGCAEAWQSYAEVLSSVKEQTPESLHRTVQYMQKATRCLSQQTGWEKDAGKTESVLEMAVKFAHVTFSCCDQCRDQKITMQMLSMARMNLRTVVTAVKQKRLDLNTGKVEGRSGALLQELERQLEEMNERTQQLKNT